MYTIRLFYDIVFYLIFVLIIGTESSNSTEGINQKTVNVNKDCADYGFSVGTMKYDLKLHNGVIIASCGLYNATRRNSYTITWIQRKVLGRRNILKECKFNVSNVNYFCCIHPLKVPMPKETIACDIHSNNEWNTEIRPACISKDITVTAPSNSTTGDNNEINELIFKYDSTDKESTRRFNIPATRVATKYKVEISPFDTTLVCSHGNHKKYIKVGLEPKLEKSRHKITWNCTVWFEELILENYTVILLQENSRTQFSYLKKCHQKQKTPTNTINCDDTRTIEKEDLGTNIYYCEYNNQNGRCRSGKIVYNVYTDIQQDILIEKNLINTMSREKQRQLEKRKLLPWAPWIENVPGVKLMGMQHFLLILGVLFGIFVIAGALSAFLSLRKRKELSIGVEICRCNNTKPMHTTLNEIRRENGLKEIERHKKKKLQRKTKEDKHFWKDAEETLKRDEECQYQMMEKRVHAAKHAIIKKAKKRGLVIKNNEVVRIKKSQVICGCHGKRQYPSKVKRSKNRDSEMVKLSNEMICECRDSAVFQEQKQSKDKYCKWKHRKEKERIENKNTEKVFTQMDTTKNEKIKGNKQVNSNEVYHKDEQPKLKTHKGKKREKKKPEHFANVENNEYPQDQNEECSKNNVSSKIISQNSENNEQHKKNNHGKIKENKLKKQNECKKDSCLYAKESMRKKDKFKKIKPPRPCTYMDKVPNRSILKKSEDVTNKKRKAKRISFSPFCGTCDAYITENNRINSLPSIHSYCTNGMCFKSEESVENRRNSFSSLHDYYNEIYYNETFH